MQTTEIILDALKCRCWYWRFKPQVLANVLQPLKVYCDKLVISIIAGAEIQTISDLIGGSQYCACDAKYACFGTNRCMVFMHLKQLNKQDRELASQVLAATGLTIWVEMKRKLMQ